MWRKLIHRMVKQPYITISTTTFLLAFSLSAIYPQALTLDVQMDTQTGQYTAKYMDSGIPYEGEYEGYHYDSEGKRITSLHYVYDKYSETIRDTPSGGTIRFETVTEMEQYINWIQCNVAGSQGKQFVYLSNADDNSVTIKKSALNSLSVNEGPGMDISYRHSLDDLPESMSVREFSEEAEKYVCGQPEYDITQTNEPFREALKTGKGVCYHYARYMKELLDQRGIRSEYVEGVYLPALTGSHVWLKVYDESNNAFYMDPTIFDREPFLDNGHCIIDLWRYQHFYEERKL